MRDDFCDLCSSDCRGRCYGAGDDVLPEAIRPFNVAAFVVIASALILAALVAAYLWIRT